MGFKCVIAEDEELLRTALASLLHEVWPQLDVVAECEDGASALEAIAEQHPDVAFLDIRMPGLTGIEVARAMSEASRVTSVTMGKPSQFTSAKPRAQATAASPWP